MGDLNLKAASGGQIVLTPTNTASNYTLTLPAKTGNIITSADTGTVTQTMLSTNVATTGPAFDVYLSGTQTLSSATPTKIAFDTKQSPDPDTGNLFNTTTYNFTPNIAGYYFLTATLFVNTTATDIYISIFKGTTEYKRLFRSGPSNVFGCSGSAIVYLNGTTDYVSIYGYFGTGQQVATSVLASGFQGFLARAA